MPMDFGATHTLSQKGVKGLNATIANYLAISHESAPSHAALVMGNSKHGQCKPSCCRNASILQRFKRLESEDMSGTLTCESW